MKHLLLLHGALGHSKDFDTYEPVLSQHFTVHKLLFTGHGGTDITSEDISMQGYVDQLKAYCELHGIDRNICLFGYSMGGYIALLFAAQNPGKVESILTLATKLNWTEAIAKKETQLLNPDILEEKVPKYAAQLKSLHGESHWRNLLVAMADAMIRLGTTPLLDSTVYHSIECKVQLMVGDKDNMTTIEETLAASREIPHANFAVLPDTNHPINTVRKELLLSLMRDFWNFQ